MVGDLAPAGSAGPLAPLRLIGASAVVACGDLGAVPGVRQAAIERLQARAHPADRALDGPYGCGARPQRTGRSLKQLERALLGMRAVWELRDQVQERGQDRDRRLVVVDRR